MMTKQRRVTHREIQDEIRVACKQLRKDYGKHLIGIDRSEAYLVIGSHVSLRIPFKVQHWVTKESQDREYSIAIA